MRCLFRHRFGLPRLDEAGVAWFACMICGRAVRCRARLAPEVDEVARMKRRRAEAIASMADRWVGLPATPPDPQAKVWPDRGERRVSSFTDHF